ncbi:MAG: hypothetical protein JNK00_09515 [Flavipsychrobacter sp.]|nr:hypothetical protein [Flavipsychrobacter sp.]
MLSSLLLDISEDISTEVTTGDKVFWIYFYFAALVGTGGLLYMLIKFVKWLIKKINR